ncbi:MAG: energy-coupled thiamine transporter ThiT [Lachnospiraceae bacterium]|nr:energy-coupled thiamine transporter ThiT [Lachnospiraceae bacterium]
MSKFSTKLTYSAMAIALATILSYVKLYDFPFGGSVTCFSMLIICLPGYWFGLGTGLLTAVAYGVLQFILNPYVLFPLQVVVDYVLAFGALGLSGVFSSRSCSPDSKMTHAPIRNLTYGYLLAIFGRFLFTSLSGWLFFGEYAWKGWNPLAYSMAYNGAYVSAEGLLTVLLLALPPVKKALIQIAPGGRNTESQP